MTGHGQWEGVKAILPYLCSMAVVGKNIEGGGAGWGIGGFVIAADCGVQSPLSE